MQKKPVIAVMNTATAYRASSGLSSVLATDPRLFGRLSGQGRHDIFCRINYLKIGAGGEMLCSTYMHHL